jgi:hypothetical protein
MSSRSPIRSERRRPRASALLLALVLALVAVQCPDPAAAAPVPLPVAAVLVRGAQTALVADLSASTPSLGRRVSVTRDGTPQPADLVPVVSDGLAVVLVVDTSAAGAKTLPAWLSAGARFILEAPATTQTVVIADSAPAAAIAGPQRGPTGVVRALTSVRARGERDTAAALGLATRQFPAADLGRRVVVLYTTGADAGGESAETLAARFRADGTILVVVGTAAGDRYWAPAAAATGGFFAPAGDPVVIPALDQVETTLRGRYLVRFPTPPALPAQVSVRVDTGDLTLTGEPVVAPAPVPAPRPAGDDSWIWVAVLLGLAVAALVAAVVVVTVRRRSRAARGAPLGDPPSQPVAARPGDAAADRAGEAAADRAGEAAADRAGEAAADRAGEAAADRVGEAAADRAGEAAADRVGEAAADGPGEAAADRPEEPVAEPPSPVVARGHAAVPGRRHDNPGPPGTVARGRAVVPDPGTHAFQHPPE